MDIKDSYLHGTVGVVKSISVDADKLKYKLADIDGTVKEVTLPSMVAATSDADGKPGLVPTPSANSLDKYLKGDGNWSDVDAAKLGGINPIGFMRVQQGYVYNGEVLSANELTVPGTYRLSLDNEDFPTWANYGNVLVVRGLTGVSYGDTLAQMYFRYDRNVAYLRTGNTTTNENGLINRAWSRFVLGDNTIKTTYDTDKGVKVELSGTFDAPKIDVTTTLGDVAISNSSNAVSGENIAKSVQLLNGMRGTKILANSDLNTIDCCENIGTYYITSDNEAKTLTNCPTSSAFLMHVYAPLGLFSLTSTWACRVRKIIDIRGKEWIQDVHTGSTAVVHYQPWRRILREDTTFTKATTSTVNGTQVVNVGTGGAVPAPQTIEDNSKFLKGDGTWATPSISGKVSNDLTLKINSGTTEGTSLYTYNGSAAKTLDIKNGTGIGFTNIAGVLSIYNSGVRSISTGSANGTISVNTNGASANVAVKGLGSAAYTNTNLYQKQSTYVNNTGEVDVYKKITITKSDLDGYGVWLHSRKQHYLLNSGAAAMSTPMNTFWELGTAYNASSKTRTISVKMIAPANSSNITLYVLVRAYTYIQVVTSGTVTISDSTSAEYEGITSSTTGWVVCLTAKWTDTTYNIVSSSANGLAPKVINTNTATVGTAYYVLASSDGSATPSWYKLPSNAFVNDDTKVTQTNTTTSASYRVLFSGNANDTTETTTARKSANLLFNPSTGNLTATSLNLNGDIVINDGTNHDRFIKFQYANGDRYGWRIGYLGDNTNSATNNYLTIDSYRNTAGWAPALQFKHNTMDATFGASVTATTFKGNLDGTYVNALTGYTKATTKEAIADTDTLNVALGKLEFKADAAYDLVKGAYDGDGTIENLAEILKVLEGIKDTETILAIIGKYLPLIGGTLTGKLTIQKDSFGSLIIYRKDSLNSASIQFKNRDNVSLGYIGMDTANKCLYRFSANSDSSYTIWDSGNDGSGSGLDADLLDGTHKADLFTSLTNVNTKANPYSLSATIGGTTKFLQVNSFSLAALDIRDTTPTPNDVSDKSVTAWFNNKDTPGRAYWYSGITVAGWNNDYRVWLLASNSDQSDTETSLHFRTGRVDTWGAWKKVLDSGNYTSYLGYIGTTSVQASSGNLALTGINNITTPSYGFTITTPSGNIQIGPQNTSGCHIYTNRDLFYFNKPIYYWDGSSYHIYINANNYTSYTPILNSSSTHATKSSVIYAPTTSGSGGDLLISDGLGSAPVWISPGNVTVGGANKADKLTVARTIALSGAVTGSASFDGSANITIATSINHTHSYLPLSGGTLTGSLTVGDKDANELISIAGNTSHLKMLAYINATYIESGNKDWNGNTPLYITGYGANQGSNLYLNFANIYCRSSGASYVNLDSGNWSTYIDVSKYLPLTGGTLYNANNMNPLSINSASGEAGIKFLIAYANKGWFGYNASYGVGIYNYTRGNYLNYKDDGTLLFEGNEVLHSGNWSNYITLPTTPSGGYVSTTADSTVNAGVTTKWGSSEYTTIENGTITCSKYGNTSTVITGGNTLYDISTKTGGWDLSLVGLVTSSTTQTLVGAYGNNGTLERLYLGGSYASPYLAINSTAIYPNRNIIPWADDSYDLGDENHYFWYSYCKYNYGIWFKRADEGDLTITATKGRIEFTGTHNNVPLRVLLYDQGFISTATCNLGNSTYRWNYVYANHLNVEGGKFYTDANGAYWTSDIRLKTNIIKARNLDIADLLVEFDWKDSGNHSWGYIAQDLLEVLPEAVSYSEDTDRYSVNYNVAHSAAIASLTARIKELEEKLEKYGIL